MLYTTVLHISSLNNAFQDPEIWIPRIYTKVKYLHPPSSDNENKRNITDKSITDDKYDNNFCVNFLNSLVEYI